MFTKVLYTIYIRLMVAGLHIAAILNNKAKKAINGRKRINLPANKTKPRVLIHCASLGEFEQAKPIIEALKRKQHYEITISFFSPSGYENIGSYPYTDHVIYLPFDLQSNVDQFLKSWNWDAIIMIKYEFWWNFIKKAIEMKIPLFFVSVHLGKNHYLLRSWSAYFRKIFKQVDHIFTIDHNAFKFLKQFGFTNISIGGDTRVASILQRKHNALPNTKLELFKGQNRLVIFGSTYPTEHKIITQFIQNESINYKIAIFPHEIDSNEIEKLNQNLGNFAALFSDPIDKIRNAQLLIVDSIGQLADAYQYADLAYIGGGFEKGIHNILEPFVYKIPLIFGPDFQKFREAVYLSEFEFVRIAKRPDEIFNRVCELLEKNHFQNLDLAFDFIFKEIDVNTIIGTIEKKLLKFEK